MILRSLFAAGVTILLLAAACSSGEPSTAGDPPAEPEQAFEALRQLAATQPVADDVRLYAALVCDPYGNFANATRDLESQLEAVTLRLEQESTEENDRVAEWFDIFRDLAGPLSDLVEGLRDIDPPDALHGYHEGAIEQIEYQQEEIDALREGEDSFFALFGGSEPPAEPELPARFGAAIILECDELGDILDSSALDAFGGEGGFASPAGRDGRSGMNELVGAGDFVLFVHKVEDPVTPANVSGEPNPGRRWLAIDLSLTNVAREAQAYDSSGFAVELAEEVRYAAAFFELAESLGSGSLAPGATLRAWVGFDVPASATLVLLIYDPEAHSETKIEIDLR